MRYLNLGDFAHTDNGRDIRRRIDAESLCDGVLVPLEQSTEEPVDVYANGRLVARGEIVVLDDCFCVRVTERIEGVNAIA